MEGERDVENGIRSLKENITNLIYLLRRDHKIKEGIKYPIIGRLLIKYIILDVFYYNSIDKELDRGINLTKELLEKVKNSENKALVETLEIVLRELESDKEELSKVKK